MNLDLVTKRSPKELARYCRANPAILKLLKTNSVFRKTYREDPVAFVHDCINFKDGEGPTDYQDELSSMVPIKRRISARGPHGLGKTAWVAWIILWFVLTRDGEDWKCPTTASAWRQLTKFLWPEIHKWSSRIIWGKTGREAFKVDKELLRESIKLDTGEAFAAASDKSELLEGAHADQLLYVLDEAKAIPESTWDAVEGAFSSGECYAVAISTPGDAAGRFYDIHRRRPGLEAWWVRHVRKEEAVKAGRISEEWIEEKKKLWGVGTPVYDSKVEGEFPKQSEDQLISIAWIEAAREKNIEPEGESIIGQDVARYGSDDSVAIEKNGQCVVSVRVVHGQNTHKVASYLKTRGCHANVDGIGVGAGVVDNLDAWGCSYTDVIVSQQPSDTEHFANLKAELYWELRRIFKEGEIDLSRMPQNYYDRLLHELTVIKTEYRNGKIYIKSKEEIRKELRKDNPQANSPDMAEALMLCYCPKKKLTMDVVMGKAQEPVRSRIGMFR